MWIKITPKDTLFFRSGRPFSMGSETWADELFPPFPSTIYGAIRTFFIFQRGSLREFKEKGYPDIGDIKTKGSMKIRGPFLSNIEENILYFPIPSDCVRKKNETKENKVFILKKNEKPSIFYSDEKLEEILIWKGKDQVDEANEYFDSIEFKKYLQSSSSNYSYISNKSFFTIEPKIGIARNKRTLTSKEGYLYRIPMIRLKNRFGFLVEIENLSSKNDFPNEGIFQLGGEGKTVSFEKIDFNPMENIENINFEFANDIFKIYLATPAIFEKGWIPKWIDENTMRGEKEGVEIQLIACAIGKYIRIGGWDIAKGEPKTMYKAVPAGSVYYIRILDGSSKQKIKDIFHFKNISDINPEEGFGLSFVGEVKS
ncbi:MAG: type III-B CRISPR module-associated protein Cmr3 [Dictyoglomaceae bacterium]|nr:type III-B CRISPR module-associated protein Cmr3 [Dictyoglomaceae bacterium]